MICAIGVHFWKFLDEQDDEDDDRKNEIEGSKETNTTQGSAKDHREAWIALLKVLWIARKLSHNRCWSSSSVGSRNIHCAW